MVRNLLALTGLLAIALVTAVGIQAYGYYNDPYDDPPPRVRVSYAGLDLADPEGRRILERRINAAIDEVCPSNAGSVIGRRYDRECREQAIAGVEPQVNAAVARAEERAAQRADAAGFAEADAVLPPLPRETPGGYRAVPPSDVEPALPPARPMRLVRRTVTTTVTTAAPAPVAPVEAVRAERPSRAVDRPLRRGYVRHSGPGTWLPAYAWPAIERAIARALATGRTTQWVARERSGYVTVSAARWINRCLCRNVRVVKHAEGRQVVVAEGLRCRWPDGGLSRRR